MICILSCFTSVKLLAEAIRFWLIYSGTCGVLFHQLKQVRSTSSLDARYQVLFFDIFPILPNMQMVFVPKMFDCLEYSLWVSASLQHVCKGKHSY